MIILYISNICSEVPPFSANSSSSSRISMPFPIPGSQTSVQYTVFIPKLDFSHTTSHVVSGVSEESSSRSMKDMSDGTDSSSIIQLKSKSDLLHVSAEALKDRMFRSTSGYTCDIKEDSIVVYPPFF
ncbi:hypothetical protein ADUPG1_008965 [Aduncisulcus paluster]|uniref:Uncharacterized protein n=1 Tax=Aduncisulcus paluster TaxID=2918883 RepID=A0ABQ5KTV5_9EUKA|nr:hypothetical protein ADUPG1_008965 [Aduncisulcus paluster]